MTRTYERGFINRKMSRIQGEIRNCEGDIKDLDEEIARLVRIREEKRRCLARLNDAETAMKIRVKGENKAMGKGEPKSMPEAKMVLPLF